MTLSVPVTDDIHWVGVNDYETHLFEAVWPLPRGVSYNSYLIDDEKVALSDGVKDAFAAEQLERIRGIIGDRPIDYLIVNHMEPDHSGTVRMLREVYPDIQIVGNQKTAGFLEQFYGITDGVKTIADGDELDLGKHKLQFFLTPMVHWPETMVTFDKTDGVLFSADAFGGFAALDDGIFDDEVDLAYYEDEILRYFSNIVGKYAKPVIKAIDKLQSLDIRVVAPTHGPVWRSNPGEIVKKYAYWSRQETEPGVVLAFGSMYGSTGKMAEAVGRALADAGVGNVRVHNVSRTHPSYIIRDTWRYSGLIIGAPTYNTGLFPPMDSLLRDLEILKMSGRHIGVFGSYGWSGGGVKQMRQFAEEGGQWDLIEPVVEANCTPNEDDLARCGELGRKMAEAVKS
ncbi:MAG: FprA family A-type flavoprotein [Phycisphaerae bacterium]